MLQYFITEQTFIPSTITLAKYLSTQCAEAFKPHDIGTELSFFNKP